MTEANEQTKSTRNDSLVPRFGSVLSALVIAASLIPLALFLFSQCGRYFYLAEIMNNFRLQLFLLLLPFLVVLLLLRRWGWAGLMGVAVLWAAMGVVTPYFPSSQPRAGEQKIKILSFNVLGENRSFSAVMNCVRKSDPDVFVIIEYTNHWIDVFESLKEDFPYTVEQPRWHGYGIAIFSKLPITEEEIFYCLEDTTDLPTIGVTIDVHGKPLKMVALHTVSPTNRYRMGLRNEQIKQLADFVGNDKTESKIVLGDYNCAPWSTYLKEFCRETGLRDGRQGFGYQGSWHAHFPVINVPIDHTFVSQDICVHDRRILDRAGSDHLPVEIVVSIGSTE